jgi:autoinducer 2-degrading protein
VFVVSVTIFVKPGHAEDFVEATLNNARHTRGEPANARFDVLRSKDDPDRFLLYEVYESEAGFRAHHQTEHYLRWRETVGPWMARPREGVKYTSLFPEPDRW